MLIYLELRISSTFHLHNLCIEHLFSHRCFFVCGRWNELCNCIFSYAIRQFFSLFDLTRFFILSEQKVTCGRGRVEMIFLFSICGSEPNLNCLLSFLSYVKGVVREKCSERWTRSRLFLLWMKSWLQNSFFLFIEKANKFSFRVGSVTQLSREPFS